MKIAYLMSRFPKITETFILFEIMALKKRKVAVEIFPLQRQKTQIMHPQARELLNQVYFYPFLSLDIIFVNLRCLASHPLKYLGTWFEVLKANWGCGNFFLGALAFYPKAVKIARQCQQQNITHIHAHFANHPAMVAFVVYRLTGIGYSFTAHGSDLHKRQQMLAKKFEHSRFTVMISQYNKQFFSDHTGIMPGDKMPVIHCGIDKSIFNRSNTTVNDHKTINLLCVASLREVKGHQYLIAACNLLKQLGVDFHLHMVGDGPKQAAIQKQISHNELNQYITLHGALTQTQVLELTEKSDICVLTSYHTKSGNREGIPVVLMEAMACERAVVASRVSGIPELVEDGVSGLLSNPQDPQDIAKQLQRLIVDKSLRQQLGQAARAKIESEYDLDRNSQKLIEYFQRFDR
jgi:glycosyltransferase involved in cell wall biosynthesis